jgi:hypothetical protein
LFVSNRGPLLCPRRLEAGQEYEWPFTFRLPDTLPPSVAWRDRSYISVDLVGAADIPRSLNQEVRFGLDVAPSPPPTIAPSVLGTQQVRRPHDTTPTSTRGDVCVAYLSANARLTLVTRR